MTIPGRLLVWGLLTACVAYSEPFPLEKSDLAPDPTLRRGVLPNGLRYAIRPNAEPRGRISLRLLIAAGSLHERDDERGLAHFVEHMVFRGTRQHPNGTLTSALQRLGIGIGPDSSAFTFFDHTIYHLELPDAKESSLRQGLSAFREYAEDVTFDAALIEKERGVVLSEKDTRDTPTARSDHANMIFLWPEARQVQRVPIGLESSILSFKREHFVDFYQAWYRPERMAVIVVGDIAPDAAERLIAEVLGPVTAHGPARPDDPSFVPTKASDSDVAVFTDPGVIGANCMLQHATPEPRATDSHDTRVKQMHRALAFIMLQRRLMRSASAADTAFVGPQASVYNSMPGWTVATLSFSGKISNWQSVIAKIEQAHRQAFLYGFTAAELHLAKAIFAADYDEAVRTATTWPSSWIAGQLATSLLEGTNFSTPAIMRDDLAFDLAAATLAQCQSAFKKAWTGKAPHVFITTNPVFAVKDREIVQALNASRETAVTPPVETKPVEFAYADFGAPGRVVHEQYADDLDVRQVEFFNGVRLNFKSTSFAADYVQITVQIGTGRLSQPENLPGIDLLASNVVPRGGLRRHSLADLEDILSGHMIHISFNVESDAFSFNATCARRELPLCLQLITAHLTDSAYRPDALPEALATFGTMYSNLAATPDGPISMQAQRLLAGGDRRFGIPVPDELYQRTIPEVTAWLEPQFQHGPIEISVVGDTSWTEVSDATARTLGTLPQRDARKLPSGKASDIRIPRPAKPSYVFTTAPQLKQVSLVWFCPVSDLSDVHHERRCRLLAALLTERLRVRIREELGATYGCDADFVQFDGFPNFSFFLIRTDVTSAQSRQALGLMKQELEALRKRKFTDDEFERVKQPFLRQRDEDLRSNAYWCYTVLHDSQRRPERFAAARDRTADTAAITRKDLEKLAKRYFDPSLCYQFVSYPAVVSYRLY